MKSIGNIQFHEQQLIFLHVEYDCVQNKHDQITSKYFLFGYTLFLEAIQNMKLFHFPFPFHFPSHLKS